MGLHYDLYWFNDFHFIGDLTRLYAYVEVENLLPVLNNKLRLANQLVTAYHAILDYDSITSN